MLEVREGDTIVWNTTVRRNPNRTREGVVTKIGEGVEAELVYTRIANGLTFAVPRDQVIEIKIRG